jgi:transcription-repair coupling factor (superfamily II helicase)
MALYRSIAVIDTKDAAKAFAARLAERHGPVPPEVMTLLGLGELKRLCREAGVEQIDVGPRGALISFRHEPKGVEAFLKRQAKARRRDDGRLAVSLEEGSSDDRVEVARTILMGLLSGAEQPVPA